MKISVVLLFMIMTLKSFAQTNTSPLPAGTTKIGGHLSAGASNEVWTDATSLYFNYRGNGAATHFWNLGGGAGKSIMSLLKNGNVGIGTTTPAEKLSLSGSGAMLGIYDTNPASQSNNRMLVM